MHLSGDLGHLETVRLISAMLMYFHQQTYSSHLFSCKVTTLKSRMDTPWERSRTLWHHDMKAGAMAGQTELVFGSCVTQLVTAQHLIAGSIQEGPWTPTWLLQQWAFRPGSWAVWALCSAPEARAPWSRFQHPSSLPGKSWKRSSPGSCFVWCQQYPSPPLSACTMVWCHKHTSFPDSSVAWETLGPGAGSCNYRFSSCWGQRFFPFLFLGQAKASGFH